MRAKKTTQEQAFFTEREICKRLNVSPPTLKKMRDAGQIDHFRLGVSVRYPASVYNGILKMEGSNA